MTAPEQDRRHVPTSSSYGSLYGWFFDILVPGPGPPGRLTAAVDSGSGRSTQGPAISSDHVQAQMSGAQDIKLEIGSLKKFQVEIQFRIKI